MSIYTKDYLKVTSKNIDGETWIRNTWRPIVAWTYIVTCAMDFIIFPVLWAIYLALVKASVVQWDPLTLKGAGLYHLAMGAILGVTAWSRGREKIALLNQHNGLTPNGIENESEDTESGRK